MTDFREVVEVTLTEPPFVAAAAYLATLAHPDIQPTSIARRERFLWALKAYSAKALRDQRGYLGTPAEFRRASTREMRGAIQTAEKKLWQRFVIAEGAGLLILSKAGGRPGNLIDVEALMRRVVRVLKPPKGYILASDYKNARRHWNATLPVLHLARALMLKHYLPQARKGNRPTILDLAFEPSWVTTCVADATKQITMLDRMVELPAMVAFELRDPA